VSALAVPRDRDWLIASVALACTVAATALLIWNPKLGEGNAVEAAPVVGKVSFSSADLRRRPAHRLGWTEVSSGGEVRELDALFVPPGVEARVTFIDGTVLELDERSLVVVDLPRAGRRSVSVRQGSVEGSAGAAGLSLETPLGTAQLAPQSGAHLEVTDQKVAVAVTHGEATVGGTKFGNGDRAGISSAGTVAEPRWPVQLAAPERNRRVVFSGAPPHVEFKWEAPPALSGRIQLARDRGFAFVLEEHELAEGGFTTKEAQVGVVWWRAVDEADEPISESRRVSVLEDVPPALIAPREGEVVLTDEKALGIFSWAQVRGVTRYRFEISQTQDFANPAFTATVDGAQLRTALSLAEGRWLWRVRPVDESRADSTPSPARVFRLIHKPLPEAPELLNPEIEVEPAPKQ
jgi:hypothetical protein